MNRSLSKMMNGEAKTKKKEVGGSLGGFKVPPKSGLPVFKTRLEGPGGSDPTANILK